MHGKCYVRKRRLLANNSSLKENSIIFCQMKRPLIVSSSPARSRIYDVAK